MDSQNVGIDPEIKPTKLIKGQGLARLMIETNLITFGINLNMELLDLTKDESVGVVDDNFKYSSWYGDIVYILQNLQAPLETNKT